MRGGFVDQGRLFSDISPGSTDSGEPSVAGDPRACARCVRRARPQLFAALRERGSSIPPEQLLSALLLQVFYGIRSGTPAHGAIGLQFSVPLVRGIVARRSGVGPHRVHQEPRPAAER